MNKKITKPELLLPAGNYEKAIAAFRYGADAIYIGMPSFSLRYRENQTTKNDLKKIVNHAHKINKKVYITLNIYPHNKSIKKIISHIKFLKNIKPDAIIFSDPGVYNLIKKNYPEAKLHLSVQATCTNYETVKFWQKLGIERIILARELSLKEIVEIHKKIPNIKLECFIHGAICMAYSGRCLISNYLTKRDANQGDCSHPCRWNYQIKTKKSFYKTTGYIKNNNQEYYLEEDLRKKEYFPIFENEHGSHILSSKDLCLIKQLKKLYIAGISSYKIEGRAKNINYVSTIARAYRKAIDDMFENKKFNNDLYNEVLSVSNRGFFTGFYFKKPNIDDHQLNANRTEGTHEFTGIVKNYDKISKIAEIECKGKIKINDKIEILTPNNIYKIKIKKIFNNKNKKISYFNPGTKNYFLIKINKNIQKGDILRKKINVF